MTDIEADQSSLTILHSQDLDSMMWELDCCVQIDYRTNRSELQWQWLHTVVFVVGRCTGLEQKQRDSYKLLLPVENSCIKSVRWHCHEPGDQSTNADSCAMPTLRLVTR